MNISNNRFISWFRHLPLVAPNVMPPIAPLGGQHEQWPLPAPPAAGPAAAAVVSAAAVVVVAAAVATVAAAGGLAGLLAVVGFAAGGLAGPLAAGFVHIISNRLGN
jgi:hypothetical protein